MGWHGPMTHRQFEVWQRWLIEQNNHPDKTDHYLMQIAYYIARGNAKNPASVTREKMRIKFLTETTKAPLSKKDEMTARIEASREARLRALSRIGSKIRLQDGTPISRREFVGDKRADEESDKEEAS